VFLASRTTTDANARNLKFPIILELATLWHKSINSCSSVELELIFPQLGQRVDATTLLLQHLPNLISLPRPLQKSENARKNGKKKGKL